ncbi:hypothetical protein ACWNX2_00515 [Candidatus Vidania fulgoroideorum]
MRYLLLVGFGNIAREFFLSFVYRNYLQYRLILVLRTNNRAYKFLINDYLCASSIKVVVLTTYKGSVTYSKCLVVELIGDNFYSKDLLLRTLLTSNYFLTANKFLLYKNIRIITNYLFTRIFFEAAIGGGLPFVRNFLMLRTVAVIKSCCAIFNGTTNYLLTVLPVSNFQFPTVLKLSATLGLSEANPIKDIYGFDAFNKIIITAYLLYKQWFSVSYFYVVPLPTSNWFYWLVSNLGYTYRYLTLLVVKGRAVHIEVSMWFFRSITSFTLTYLDYNSVTLTTKSHGYFTTIAKGAGAAVTTYSLLSDFECFCAGVKSSTYIYTSLDVYALCLIRSYYIFILDLSVFARFLVLLLLLRCSVSFFIATKLVVFYKSKLGFSALRKILAFLDDSALYYRIL